MKSRRQRMKIFLSIVVCFFISILCANAYDLPIRVIARSDVSHLLYHKYAVVEFLEIYNDDYSKPLIVNSITADTWIGHRKYKQNENWKDTNGIIVVEPCSVRRVAERKRIVVGYVKRNWWIRWIRFKVSTSRGIFYSNFVSSPFKRPGKVRANIVQPLINSTSEPGELTPIQKESLKN